MRFIVDSHLPRLLADRLTAAGHQSWHVGDVTDADAPDGVIWHVAARLGCGVVTKDRDFLKLSFDRGAEVPVLWVRLGDCRNARLVEVVMTGIERAANSFAAGEAIVELH